jgi:hypothetical protein
MRLKLLFVHFNIFLLLCIRVYIAGRTAQVGPHFTHRCISDGKRDLDVTLSPDAFRQCVLRQDLPSNVKRVEAVMHIYSMEQSSS